MESKESLTKYVNILHEVWLEIAEEVGKDGNKTI
jgi:hypothetical protein